MRHVPERINTRLEYGAPYSSPSRGVEDTARVLVGEHGIDREEVQEAALVELAHSKRECVLVFRGASNGESERFTDILRLAENEVWEPVPCS